MRYVHNFSQESANAENSTASSQSTLWDIRHAVSLEGLKEGFRAVGTRKTVDSDRAWPLLETIFDDSRRSLLLALASLPAALQWVRKTFFLKISTGRLMCQKRVVRSCIWLVQSDLDSYWFCEIFLVLQYDLLA